MITFELDVPNAQPLMVQRKIKCIEPTKRKKTKTETKIREPKINPIRKADALWQQLGYNDDSVGQIYMAGADSAIVVSIENSYLQDIIQKYRLKEDMIEGTKDRYVAAIAFYLLLREVDKRKKRITGELDESADSVELQRIARTVSQLALPIETL
ncbi:MAG: hypothetical protein HZB92_02295 [Euryarchaeota archaeon]|nr:hypothetical protein [Euryarchaeota archaeon]